MESRIVRTCAIVWTLLTLHYATVSGLDSFAEAEWPNSGGGIENRREVHSQNCVINEKTAPKLKLKWRFITGHTNFSDVTATPSISDDFVYFPDWAGFLYAVHRENGTLAWKTNLTDVTGTGALGTVFSKHTPVVSGKYLFVGLQSPAVVLAVDRRNGDLIWAKVLDPTLGAIITMSGTVYGSYYYVGVSSAQEGLPVELCCTFQGSFVKIDIETGKIVWRTKMLPDNGGEQGLYAGAALWGSSPSIDAKRNLVFIATGNNYQVPPSVQECQKKQDNKTVPDNPDPCILPGDHSESILALDLDTGDIKWSHHLGGYDTYVTVCPTNPSVAKSPNCPKIPGPDYDFGEAPMMLTITKITKHSKDAAPEEWQDIVVAGQKSGIVWALDRDDGRLVWANVAGPGGDIGGVSYGSATDSHRVYVSIVNNRVENFTLVPSKNVTQMGGWVGIDASNGTTLWTTATPGTISNLPTGPVSVANGVLFTTSLGPLNGSLYALDAKTGGVLWEYNFNTAIYGGVSLDGDCVFLGQGIEDGFIGFVNHGGAVSAFCIEGD
ncbi:unnamed protein product [Sphagnum tenellum]